MAEEAEDQGTGLVSCRKEPYRKFTANMIDPAKEADLGDVIV